MSKDMQQSDESETEEVEQGVQPVFRGKRNFKIKYNKNEKSVTFGAKQVLVAFSQINLRIKGSLDTKTNNHAYSAIIQKDIQTNTPSMIRLLQANEEKDINGKILPGGLKSFFFQDWLLSPGLRFSNTPDSAFKYAMGLRKFPQVIRHTPTTDLYFQGKGALEIDSKSSQVSGYFGLRVMFFRPNLTEKQDGVVSVGLDATHEGGKLASWPYVKLAENQLSVKLQKGMVIWACEL
jgi:hypothetical protein